MESLYAATAKKTLKLREEIASGESRTLPVASVIGPVYRLCLLISVHIEVDVVRHQRMKVVPREPQSYLLDVALRPFQKRMKGFFICLSFSHRNECTTEEHKSYDGTSNGSGGIQRAGGWWKACMLRPRKRP